MPESPISPTPWTPAPWRYVEATNDYGPYADVLAPPLPERHPRAVVSHIEQGATGRLIALAPEMAQAILAYDETRRQNGCDAWGGLDVVAEKLRGIGNA